MGHHSLFCCLVGVIKLVCHRAVGKLSKQARGLSTLLGDAADLSLSVNDVRRAAQPGLCVLYSLTAMGQPHEICPLSPHKDLSPGRLDI